MDQPDEKSVVLEGQTGFYKGKTYPLDRKEFVIGRSKDCHLVMEEKTISARHAKISRLQDSHEIEDLGSTNSTFVNGSRVQKRQLRTGDKIRFDVFEFTFINPMDVPRTALSSTAKTESFQKTDMSPEKNEPQIHPPRGSEKTQPLPGKSGKRNRPSPGRSDFFPGLVLGLLVAFVLSYGGTLLAIMIKSQPSGPGIWTFFKNELLFFPLKHLHTTWLNTGNWNPATGIGLLALVLGPIIGALIVQDTARKKKPATALLFSAFYAGLAALAQWVILSFDVNSWINTTRASGLGISAGIVNFLAVMGYFWAICFILSLLGTLAGKKG